MTLLETQLPSQEDAQAAKQSSLKLAPLVASGKSIQVQITSTEGKVETVTLPPAAISLIQRLLAELGAGNAVNVTPIHAMLTTQEAADLLGVSRPYLIKEIEAKNLPCILVGTHRRIPLDDVLKYKARCRAIHDEVMNELTAQSQELGLY